MKKLISLFLGIVLFSCSPTEDLKNQNIITNYDDVEDQTTIKTPLRTVYNGLEGAIKAQAMVKCTGQYVPCHDTKFVDLIFTTRSPDWTILYDAKLVLIMDGQRYSISENQKGGRLDNGYSSEVSVAVLEKDIFKKFAFAKDVELRLANKELTIPYNRRFEYRMFAGRVIEDINDN